MSAACAPGKDKKPPNPCKKDCPNRHSHCHGDCEAYLEFYNWHRQENEERHRAQEALQLHMKAVQRAKKIARQMKGRNG